MTTWVFIKSELARLLELSLPGVQRLVRVGEIDRVVSHGRVTYVVDPERLTKPKHRRRVLAWIARTSGRVEAPAPAVGKAFDDAPGADKDAALEEYQQLQAWETERRRLAAEGPVPLRIASQLVAKKLGRSYSTLCNRAQSVRKHGVDGLVRRRRRTGPGGKSDPRVVAAFVDHILDPRQPKAAAIGRKIPALFQEPVKVPSSRTFQRIAASIPAATKTLYRRGPEVFDREVAPYPEQDWSRLAPFELVIGDQHTCDFLVIGSNGKPCRPTYEVFHCPVSKFVWASTLYDGPPSAEATLATLAEGAREYGAPGEIILDNHQAYRADAVTAAGRVGHRRRSENDERRVAAAATVANLKVTFALPRNPTGKATLERFFGTFEGDFGKSQIGYVGPRPGELSKAVWADREIRKRLSTIDEARPEVKAWESKVYHQAANAGLDGRTPSAVLTEALESGRTVINRVKPDTLKYLFMPARAVKVGRNGVRIAATGTWYWSEELVPHFGKTVVPRYSPADVGVAYVFTVDGQHICNAPARDRLYHGAPKEKVAEVMRQKRRARKVAADYAALRQSESREPNLVRRVLAVTPDPSPLPRAKVIRPHRTRLDAGAVQAAKAAAPSARRDDGRAERERLKAAMLAGSARPTTTEDQRQRFEDLARRFGYGDQDG